MSTNFFDFREKLLTGDAAEPAAPAPAATGAGRPEPMSVSQLTRLIEGALQDAFPYSLLVRGEMSNVNRHRVSGHIYFTLKDREACLDCVMFKSDAARLRFEPADGLEMVASGRIGVYVLRGRYQLYATRLEPVGQGALELAFQQLRAKLDAEGLFGPQRKRPLPRFPLRIALLTSRQTAALQDMLKVLRRYPWLRLFLYHLPVQGDGSAERIAEAIAHLNATHDRVGGIDVMLLARGGGSLEDLWEFNEEALARAMAASRIPIVTGIGHEVDTSIADLVADHHAHTPTEAAQVVTAYWRSAQDALEMHGVRLRQALRSRLETARHRLASIERHEAFRRPADTIDRLRQRLDDRERSMLLALGNRLRGLHAVVLSREERLELRGPAARVRQLRADLSVTEQRLCHVGETRLRRAYDRLAGAVARLRERHPRHALRLAEQRVTSIEHQLRCEMSADVKRRALHVEMLARHLQAVGPEQVLARGYSITFTKKGRRVVRSTEDVKPGDALVTRLSDGEIESTVEDPRQPKLFE